MLWFPYLAVALYLVTNVALVSTVDVPLAVLVPLDDPYFVYLGYLENFSSGITVPVALAMNSFQVYQCSGASTTPELSNKDMFPYFLGPVPSDENQGKALVKLLAFFQWRKVALITVNTSYGIGGETPYNLSRVSYRLQQEKTSPSSATKPTTEALRTLDSKWIPYKDSDARVIVVIGYDIDTINILRAASKRHLVGPEYVWIGTDAVQTMFNLLYDSETRGSFSDEDRRISEGMMFTVPSERGGKGWDIFNKRYESLVGELPMPYSYFYRDCLLTFALGIKRSIGNGRAPSNITSLFSSMSRSTFTNVTFEGASGLVMFDDKGDRLSNYLVQNIVRGKLVESIQIVGENFTIQVLQEVVFAGGATSPPPDGKILMREVIERTSTIGVVIIIFHIMGILSCFAAGVVIVLNRATTPIRQTSMLFLLIEGTGIAIVYGSVYGWIGRFEDSKLACLAQQWLGWIGFSTVMQAVIPRCWRIYCIFENNRLQNASYLRDHLLYGSSIWFTVINVILLTTWSVMDPLRPTMVTVDDRSLFHYECQSRSLYLQEAFTIALLVYNGVLLSIAILLAYVSRKVLSSYRETAYILYGAQNILLCSVLVIGLVYGASRSGAYIIASATLLTKESLLKLRGSGEQMGSEVDVKDSLDFNSDTLGPVEITIPVKDGSRVLATWEKKMVIYHPITRNFGIVDTKTMVGELAIFSSSVNIQKSTTYPDCLDIRFGSKYRVLQFSSAAHLDKFQQLIAPGLKVGARVTGFGEDLTRLRRGLQMDLGLVQDLAKEESWFRQQCYHQLWDLPPTPFEAYSSKAARHPVS
ncbi:periplasmic binding protein-like I [Chytridium lagenaria]|nr:periplasmic binding protein-like I [Chytridium lagenaria]